MTLKCHKNMYIYFSSTKSMLISIYHYTHLPIDENNLDTQLYHEGGKNIVNFLQGNFKEVRKNQCSYSYIGY